MFTGDAFIVCYKIHVPNVNDHDFIDKTTKKFHHKKCQLTIKISLVNMKVKKQEPIKI